MAITTENYICLSAMLRARETRLLTDEKAQRMTDAPSYEEAAKILADCGYNDMSKLNLDELGEALNAHLSSEMEEVKRFAPDKKVVDMFLLKYDYHNIKVMLKSEAMGLDAENLYSATGRISPEKLEYAYKEQSYREIEPIMAKAIVDAGEVLARTANPQKADFILDKAYFEELTSIAKELDVDFIYDYVKLLIDAANLKSYVRTFKMGKYGDFLEEVIIDGGSVSSFRLLEAGDVDAIVDLYSHSPLEEAALLAKDTIASGKMTDFEKSIDNAVSEFIKKTRLITYGPESIVSYLASVESEVTAVRMILSCRLAGVKSDTIKERLRDMYA